jgi:hypothetical protein
MHTEDEAREKWCPFVRMTQAERMAPAVNRVEGPHAPKGKGYGQTGCQCIASECMAWRWGPDEHTVQRDGRMHITYGKDTGKGECGLAGR